MAKTNPKRKIIPRQAPPKQIQREYATKLGAAVKRAAHAAFASVLPDLKRVLAQSASARKDSEATDARRLVEEAHQRMLRSTGTEVQAIATQVAKQTSAYQRIQLGRQAQSALGIDLGQIGDSRTQRNVIDSFADANVALIRGVSDKTAASVHALITGALVQGRDFSAIAGDLQVKLDISASRAAFVASDQVHKLYSQVNVMRQKQLGVKQFIWRHGDSHHPRPEHLARDGRIYDYENQPADMPGDLPGCQCTAEPVFDGDSVNNMLSDLQNEQESAQEERATGMGLGRIGVSSEVAGEEITPFAGDRVGARIGVGAEEGLTVADPFGAFRIGVSSEIAGAEPIAAHSLFAPIASAVTETVAPELASGDLFDPQKAIAAVSRPLVPPWYRREEFNGETRWRDTRKGRENRAPIPEKLIVGSGNPDAFVHVWPDDI